MRTLILAGGRGIRLKDVWDKPKCLFEIKGKPLLEYSLDALSKAGISEVDLLIGYGGKLVRDRFGSDFRGMRIAYSQSEVRGTMHAVYSALEEPEDCLVLDGDLVFSSEVPRSMLASPRRDLAFLTKCCGNGDETYVVLDSSERITYLSLNKKADRDLINQQKVFEFNGVSKFSREFMAMMLQLHSKRLSTELANAYYEEVAFDLAKNHPWYGLVNTQLVLAEVDRKEDLPRAIKVIKKWGCNS